MWVPLEVLGCLLSNSSQISRGFHVFPNSSMEVVEGLNDGLLPVNISNGDGRVRADRCGPILHKSIIPWFSIFH